MFKKGSRVSLKTEMGRVDHILDDICIESGGEVTVTLKRNGRPTSMTHREFVEAVDVKPSNKVQESISMPVGSLWRGQFVQVYKAGTSEKVDTGNITRLTHDVVEVNGEKYDQKSYTFLAIG